jgi:hypothetical protein
MQTSSPEKVLLEKVIKLIKPKIIFDKSLTNCNYYVNQNEAATQHQILPYEEYFKPPSSPGRTQEYELFRS